MQTMKKQHHCFLIIKLNLLYNQTKMVLVQFYIMLFIFKLVPCKNNKTMIS